MTTELIYATARRHGADEATSRDIAGLLAADWSGYRDLWLERMTDIDGWCTRVPDEIPKYLNVADVRAIIGCWERSHDPFDPDTLRIDAWLAAAKAGGTFVSENIETGEIAIRYTLPGSRQGAAPEN